MLCKMGQDIKTQLEYNSLPTFLVTEGEPELLERSLQSLARVTPKRNTVKRQVKYHVMF